MNLKLKILTINKSINILKMRSTDRLLHQIVFSAQKNLSLL
jgi:hypothetical protein